MKKLQYCAVLWILALLVPVQVQSNPNKKHEKQVQEFQQHADTNGLIFICPEGYEFVKVIPNEHMNYEWALKSKTLDLEIRFAIRRHQLFMPKQMISMTMLNISGGIEPNFGMFPSVAVRSEFNADAGSSGFTKVLPDFGGGDSLCFVVNIAKKGVGDAYIFFLSNDQNIISDHMMDAFHSLKFKPNHIDSLYNRILYDKTYLAWLNEIGEDLYVCQEKLETLNNFYAGADSVEYQAKMEKLNSSFNSISRQYSFVFEAAGKENEETFIESCRKVRAEIWALKSEISKALKEINE